MQCSGERTAQPPGRGRLSRLLSLSIQPSGLLLTDCRRSTPSSHPSASICTASDGARRFAPEKVPPSDWTWNIAEGTSA